MPSFLRIIFTFIIFAVTVALAIGDQILLPPVFPRDDALRMLIQQTGSGPNALEVGTVAVGSNNLVPLRSVTDYGIDSRLIGGDVSANLEYGYWLRTSKDGWIASIGNGYRDSYSGNRDAGQLYIDMLSDDRRMERYYPSAGQCRMWANWYGMGRRIEYRKKSVAGEVELYVRYIEADDYLARSANGVLQEDNDFRGFIRVVSSEYNGDRVKGSGWAIDMRTRGTIGDRITYSAAMEGLAGQIKWHGLHVDDAYVMSPDVFVDPDGFYRDIGGISGTTWRENKTLKPLKHGSAEFVYTNNGPSLLYGFEWVESYGFSSHFGLALRPRKSWLVYTRWYPDDGMLECGALGSGWSLGIKSDELSPNSAKSVSIYANISAFRF